MCALPFEPTRRAYEASEHAHASHRGQSRLKRSFQAVVRQTHELMSAAIQRGDTKELERSGAFAVSQHYARFTAGLIAAVKRSGLADDTQLAMSPLMKGILDLAEQPAIIVGADDGLDALFDSIEDDPMESALSAGAPSSSGSSCSVLVLSQGTVARCPGCKCEYDEGEAAALPLALPCRFHPKACWCETIPREQKYCRLCVKYYKDKAKDKQQCVVRTDKMEQARQKRAAKRTASEASLVSPSAAKRRISSSGSFSSPLLIHEI